MRALVLEHVRHEDIAAFRAPIEEAGYAIEAVHAPDGIAATAVVEADLLVVMGGPMGAYETDAHPWLADEIAAIGARLALDRPTLGICLGSQLIAAALGARVYPGPVKEVGFAPLAMTGAGMRGPTRHLADVPVLHWHGDTFELPESVELLASSARYAHQAFRRGDRLLALQCHPEMGLPGALDAWLEGASDYLAEAGTTAERVADEHDRLGPAAVAAGRVMLAEWLRGVVKP